MASDTETSPISEKANIPSLPVANLLSKTRSQTSRQANTDAPTPTSVRFSCSNAFPTDEFVNSIKQCIEAVIGPLAQRIADIENSMLERTFSLAQQVSTVSINQQTLYDSILDIMDKIDEIQFDDDGDDDASVSTENSFVPSKRSSNHAANASTCSTEVSESDYQEGSSDNEDEEDKSAGTDTNESLNGLQLPQASFDYTRTHQFLHTESRRYTSKFNADQQTSSLASTKNNTATTTITTNNPSNNSQNTGPVDQLNIKTAVAPKTSQVHTVIPRPVVETPESTTAPAPTPETSKHAGSVPKQQAGSVPEKPAEITPAKPVASVVSTPTSTNASTSNSPITTVPAKPTTPVQAKPTTPVLDVTPTKAVTAVPANPTAAVPAKSTTTVPTVPTVPIVPANPATAPTPPVVQNPMPVKPIDRISARKIAPLPSRATGARKAAAAAAAAASSSSSPAATVAVLADSPAISADKTEITMEKLLELARSVSAVANQGSAKPKPAVVEKQEPVAANRQEPQVATKQEPKAVTKQEPEVAAKPEPSVTADQEANQGPTAPVAMTTAAPTPENPVAIATTTTPTIIPAGRKPREKRKPACKTFTYVYIEAEHRMQPRDVRNELVKLGISRDKLLDAHCPSYSVVAALFPDDYLQEALDTLNKHEVSILEDYDPLDHKNLGDSMYKNWSAKKRAAILRGLHEERMSNAVKHTRGFYKMEMAWFFEKKGWVSHDCVLEAICYFFTAPPERNRNANKKTNANNNTNANA